MPDKELKKPHLKTSIFSSYLRILRNEYPHIDPASLIEEAGLTLDYIEDEDNWVSIEFDAKLMKLISNKTGDLLIHKKAGRAGVSVEGLGKAMYLLGRYLIPLGTIYSKAPHFASLLNKLVKSTITFQEGGTVKYSFVPVLDGLSPKEQELLFQTMPIMLENTEGYFENLPRLKGLPTAKTKSSIRYDANIPILELEISYSIKMEKALNYMKLLPIITVGALFISLQRYSTMSTQNAIFISISALFVYGILKLILKLLAYKQLAHQTESTLFEIDRSYRKIYVTQKRLQRKLNETEAFFDLVSSLTLLETEEIILRKGCEALVSNLGYDRAFILIEESKSKQLKFVASSGDLGEFGKGLSNFSIPTKIEDDDPNKFSNVFKNKKPLLVKDVEEHLKTLNDDVSVNLLKASKSTSFIVAPISTPQKGFGLIIADCISRKKTMNEEDLRVLSTVGGQLAIALEQQRATQDLVKAYQSEAQLAESYSRFVPWETLRVLDYETVFQVKMGDGKERSMAVLFTDIRDFTSLAETMNPRDVLKFLNSYYAQIAPLIRAKGGTIDKFMGDGLMALFPSSENAISAAIDIQNRVVSYNLENRIGNRLPISAGIGISFGPVIFGPLGSQKRLELTAISDTVNTAARLDSMCRDYSAEILISGDIKDLPTSENIFAQKLGDISVKGKLQKVPIVEIIFSSHVRELLENETDSKKITYLKGLLEEKSKKLSSAIPITDIHQIKKIAS